MSVEQKKLASRIYNKYYSHLDDLPAKERIHFVRRAYRVSGDAELAIYIKKNTVDKTIPSIKKYSLLLEDILSGSKEYPQVKFNGVLHSSNKRAIKRREALQANPEIQFYRRHLMNLFQAKLMRLDSSLLLNEWGGYIGQLRQIDFEKFFVNEVAVTAISSFAVNCATFISKIEVDSHFADRFVEFVKSYYFDNDFNVRSKLTKSEFRTLVYNLTHIIIADSSFYQDNVSKNLWINKFFANNIDQILEKCNLDIIAEVGLCFKLTNQQELYNVAVTKINDYVLETFDDSMLSAEVIAKKEHTNCVIMLLFWEVSDWHKGPFF